MAIPIHGDPKIDKKMAAFRKLMRAKVEDKKVWKNLSHDELYEYSMLAKEMGEVAFRSYRAVTLKIIGGAKGAARKNGKNSSTR